MTNSQLKTIQRQCPKSFRIFLNMYILWLQTLKIVMWTLTGELRGVSRYFGHIFISLRLLFIFYHVRCLNTLNFGHWLNYFLSLVQIVGHNTTLPAAIVVLLADWVYPLSFFHPDPLKWFRFENDWQPHTTLPEATLVLPAGIF